MINVSQRPAEAKDRAVPGHWEGDLIIGRGNASAIGTLVERTTGYTMLVHLPEGYKPEQVAPALAAKIQTLPQVLRRSLTWDQGVEMRDWKQVAVAADIDIYFCCCCCCCCSSSKPPLPGFRHKARLSARNWHTCYDRRPCYS